MNVTLRSNGNANAAERIERVCRIVGVELADAFDRRPDRLPDHPSADMFRRYFRCDNPLTVAMLLRLLFIVEKLDGGRELVRRILEALATPFDFEVVPHRNVEKLGVPEKEQRDVMVESARLATLIEDAIADNGKIDSDEAPPIVAAAVKLEDETQDIKDLASTVAEVRS